MAKKQTQQDLDEINKLLIEQAKQQANVSNSLEDYLAGLKKSKALNETILNNKKLEGEYQQELDDARRNEDIKAMHNAKLKLKILKKQTPELERQLALLGATLKAVDKTNLVMGKMLGSAVKGFGKLPDLIKNSYGKLESYGLFKLDKSIKTSALSMGILSKQSEGFRGSIKSAALDTTQIGVGIEELSKIQSDYGEELGRNVLLNKEGLVAMGQIAAATGLGAEGTAKMAADFENQGISAEHTAKYVEDTMNDAHKMGLNASKVIKNVSSNIKMLNKYNFKDGSKGLAKMAESVSKLGVQMEFISGFAEKLFDIEGAVDLSATLQTLGGAWSQLADPFKLMFMARNDIGALTEAIGKAAEASVHFNSVNGEFEISSLEMSRLRKVSEQTGIALDDLAKSGKNAAKFTKIKGQMSFAVDKETQEFLTTTAQLDEKGQGFIKIGADKKYLSQLTASDSKLLKDQMKEKASLETRAKQSRTFDDALTNTVNMFKVTLLPLIETMNTTLLPKIDGLVKRFTEGKWGEKIESFAKTIGTLVSTIGGFIIDNPITSAFILGTGKLASFIFDKLQWIENGRLLSIGFNSGAVSGGLMNNLTSIFGGGGTLGILAKAVGGLAAVVGSTFIGSKLGGVASEAIGNKDTKEGDTTAMWGSALALGIGALLAAPTGGLSLVGAAALAGGGALGGKMIGDSLNSPTYDGLFTSPIHDGISGGLGSDFSKSRGIIQAGRITPIDNKDDLISMKRGGPIHNSMKETAPQTMKIEFGDIHFSFDDLKVTTPGGGSVDVNILKNPQFIRNITSMIHTETQRTIQGGKSRS